VNPDALYEMERKKLRENAPRRKMLFTRRTRDVLGD
jgi:hypothetical protein